MTTRHLPVEEAERRSDVPAGQPVGGATRRWCPPLSIAVLAVPTLIVVVRLASAARQPFDFAGDEAILEASVRHFSDQLVGPYSRFGFHQPGPAYYYLLAPIYWLLGGSAAALFVGAASINFGAALACVLVVRRFVGETAARWSAAVVGVLLLSLGPSLVVNPWNPYVLALPVLLTVLLAAAGAGGSWAAAAGAVAVASFVVQTHLATAPTLAVIFGTTAALGVALHRSNREPSPGAPLDKRGTPQRRPGRKALLFGGFLILLVWTPPLIEQTTRSPGNLSRLARFFSASHPEHDRGIDHSVATTTGQVAAQLTVVPFGHDRITEPTDPAKVTVAGVGVAGAAAVMVVGWRRRHPVIASLGASSFVGPLVAIWSATRIVGEVFPYLLVWTSPLLVPAAIGAAVALEPVRRRGVRYRRWVSGLTAMTATAVGLTLTWTASRELRPYGTSSEVAAATALTRSWLGEQKADEVRVRIGEHDRWPLASGVAVRLDKDGIDATVDQEWTFLFGDHFRPTGNEDALIWIAAAASRPPEDLGLRSLGVVGQTSVWIGSSARP